MRIAHFIATNFVGGPEKQILNHVSRLRPDENPVLLISFDEPGGIELKAEAEKRGFRCELLPAGKWAIGGVLARLRTLHDEWRPDVVCAHGYKAGFYTILLRRMRGCRFVAFSRGWTSENLKIHLYGMVDKAIVRFADVIVAVSNSQRMRLLQAWVPDSRIVVVENAVTVSGQAASDPASAMDIRAELGLPADTPLVLAAGRLSPEKGYDDLLRAMVEVRRAVPDACLLLAGAGMLDAELKAQAKALGLDAGVRFLGFRKDILAMYGQVNVFALSSLSEGLPNVILESMAIGLPVVATRVGGLPEIIDDGRTGILVEPRATSALAAGLVRMLTDSAFAREVARQAREDVYNRFSPEVQTERLLDVYRRAMRA